MPTTLTLPYTFGDRVIIDGDASIVGRITAAQFREFGNYALLEVSYVHNGECKTSWIEAWRLTKAET